MYTHTRTHARTHAHTHTHTHTHTPMLTGVGGFIETTIRAILELIPVGGNEITNILQLSQFVQKMFKQLLQELSFLCHHTMPYIHPHNHSASLLLHPTHQMHFPNTTYHYVLRLARRDGVSTRQTRLTAQLTVSSSPAVRNPCWRPSCFSVSPSVGRPEEDEGRYVVTRSCVCCSQ